MNSDPGKSIGVRNSFRIYPIGVIRSEYKDRKEAPKQGIDREEISRIIIYDEFKEALKGIEDYECLLVLYWMNLANREVLWSERRRKGIFATRSPERPNPVAIAIVKLVKVKGNELYVKYLDAIDGTPVIDIKPYFEDMDRCKW